MMDNFNPKKRYNQFRQARKRKNKFAVPEINTDETSGRHYKLERFLKDCVTYLPMQIIDFEEVETPNEDESAESAAKQKRSKHIKLPLLNECKGIFENVVIGRSARKGENLAAVGATPEDIARLDEDLHALAKVGPDSEMSFEIALPVELQQEQANPPLQGKEIQHGEDQDNRETIKITDKSSEQPQGVTSTMAATEGLPVPDAMDTDFVPNRILEDLNGEPSYANHQSSPDQANVADVSNALFTGKSYDSGFKGSPTISLRKDDDNSDRGSHHCDRHRLNASGRKRSFFDTDSILKSNEAVGRGSGTNEIFSNWRDPPLKGSWLFGSLGGPSNFLESTYPSPGPSFDSEGIRIQSMGRPKEVRANHGGDYCGNRHPLKRRPRQTDLYEEPYRLGDPSITADVLHCFSPINKYRYDRPLSPRQY